MDRKDCETGLPAEHESSPKSPQDRHVLHLFNRHRNPVHAVTAGSYWPVTLTIDQRTIENEAWRFDNNIRQIADASDAPSQHTVSIGVAEGYTSLPQDSEPAFYALNLEVFEQIIDELKASEFVPTIFEDGKIEGEYTAEDDGNLLPSVPYDEG